MKKWVYIFLLLLAACHSSVMEVDPGTIGYTYFPLEEKRFTVYEVEEITYSIAAEPVTKKYQLKEVVAQPYTDLAGQETFPVHRFYRSTDQDPWATDQDSVWTARREISRATRTENNITFVKLLFPLKQHIKWDGNRFNNLGTEEYTVVAFNKPFQLLAEPYDHTLTISQRNIDDLCNKDVRYEVYAENTGLIYKESAVLSYMQVNNECPLDKKINYGVVYTQKLIASGKE